MKERLEAILVKVFGQKKLLKDKKSGAIHVMMFYGFLLVQFGAIDLIVKGLSRDHIFLLDRFIQPLRFSRNLLR